MFYFFAIFRQVEIIGPRKTMQGGMMFIRAHPSVNANRKHPDHVFIHLLSFLPEHKLPLLKNNAHVVLLFNKIGSINYTTFGFGKLRSKNIFKFIYAAPSIC